MTFFFSKSSRGFEYMNLLLSIIIYINNRFYLKIFCFYSTIGNLFRCPYLLLRFDILSPNFNKSLMEYMRYII